MLTELPVGYSITVDDVVFTLEKLCIRVEQGKQLLAILPVLNSNGIRVVRTQEEFETEVAFWLKDIT